MTQMDKKAEMLREMRSHVTTMEAPLDEVLAGDRQDLNKRFPDANTLLSEVRMAAWVLLV